MLGVFDSGSGGLSVLRALRLRAPRADVCYFGDIANAPYGTRSADELIALTKAGVTLLKERGATEIVSACNSVSPAVLSGAASTLPSIEMTKPTAHGMRAFAGKRLLLIATPATVAANIYGRALAGIVHLDQLPIPELAGAIELGAPERKIARIVRAAFAARASKHYDALLLGCTHYPLARDVIAEAAREAFGDIECVDPAAYVADDVARTFKMAGSGTLAFLISRNSSVFRGRVAALLPHARYSIEIVAPR